MNSEQDLLQKLMISKKIMEKHNEIGRGQSSSMTNSSQMVENFEPVSANYNLPNDLINEINVPSQQPIQNNIPVEQRIAKSKLPDEIKRLMMEHPIQQPTMGMGTQTVLSDELVEKASRLMNTNAKGEVVNEQRNKQRTQQQISSSSSLSENQIRDIVRETVENVLKENGLLIESEINSNEQFKFRVGQHLFEGKVNKIRKMSK
jgi:hypothetical protein